MKRSQKKNSTRTDELQPFGSTNHGVKDQLAEEHGEKSREHCYPTSVAHAVAVGRSTEDTDPPVTTVSALLEAWQDGFS